MDSTKETVVPVIFKGELKPAFPDQVFRVAKVDSRGKVVTANLSLISVSAFIAQGAAKYAVNATFSPKERGFFRISLKEYVGGSKGPTVELINQSSEEIEFLICFYALSKKLSFLTMYIRKNRKGFTFPNWHTLYQTFYYEDCQCIYDSGKSPGFTFDPLVYSSIKDYPWIRQKKPSFRLSSMDS